VRILVVTVVHTPLDARIYHRQIRSLVEAGDEVTYAAPWSTTGTPPPTDTPIRTVDLPHARGRHRLGALRAARRLLRRSRAEHDLVLLHDPELLLAIIGRRRRLPPVVLDVHEDTATSLIDRPWVPRALRGVASWLIRRLELWAERHIHLLLAERSYQQRFLRPHSFVPNVPPRPSTQPSPPGDRRVVYLGRIARSRGALEILEVATALHDRFDFDLIGPADRDVEPLVSSAVEAGHVRWQGFVPNEEALASLDGAMAGLSLVHPQPNHAGSLQTKVLEYVSRGVPVITTDLPVTGPFVREHGIGLVVPPFDPRAVQVALERLHTAADERRAMATRGITLTHERLNWQLAGKEFVATLHAFAGAPPSRGTT
jgi:glycosyltransferase involved in cell wall biosynthesis